MEMHFFTFEQLAQIQSLGNSGARTPISHHGSFTDKMVEDALFPQGVSPPPHLNNLHSSNRKYRNKLKRFDFMQFRNNHNKFCFFLL